MRYKNGNIMRQVLHYRLRASHIMLHFCDNVTGVTLYVGDTYSVVTGLRCPNTSGHALAYRNKDESEAEASRYYAQITGPP